MPRWSSPCHHRQRSRARSDPARESKSCGIPRTTGLSDWNCSPHSHRISGSPRHTPGTRKGCRIRGIPRLNDRNRSPETCYVSGATDHFHRCANPNPGKKFSSKVSRHPNTTVRCRIARQVTRMHPDATGEFHKVGHRSRRVVTPRRDM